MKTFIDAMFAREELSHLTDKQKVIIKRFITFWLPSIYIERALAIALIHFDKKYHTNIDPDFINWLYYP